MAAPSETEPASDDPVEPAGPIRVLQVLETVAGIEQPASLEVVASAAKLTVSKAYRALRALQDHGFVEHVGRQGYRLGGRAVALASLIGPRPALKRAAQPVLNRLATAVGETVTLHLRSGASRVVVLGAEPRPPLIRHRGADENGAGTATAPLHRAVMIGERAPLTSGCSGTAILAFLPAATIDGVLAAQPARVPRRLGAAALARIREDGYAMSFSDNHVGLNGVAAPVLDPDDGVALASMVISGAEAKLPEPVLRELSSPLTAACAELAGPLAAMLGPHSSHRLASQDVIVSSLLQG